MKQLELQKWIPRLGVPMAITVIVLWIAFQYLALTSSNWSWIQIVGMMLLLTHLYTGLFITAHDAMHGTVSLNKKINAAIGRVCLTLFMFNRWNLLLPAHGRHHAYVGTDNDPDFHPPGFFAWYFKFLKGYFSIIQLVCIAVLFNGLLWIGIEQQNLILFWVIPSFLSTFQLFYFGTYLPHKDEHDNEHRAGSFRKNHLLAFLSCYFFGYHLEHHEVPACPWWMLWKLR